jgi:dTDP-4-amino-4,6-dideoxygalactose transaminase
VDIEERRPHIDVSAIRAAITDRTVGIIPVHLYGGMADMVQIYDLAKSSGLFVLEDSAQAHGANRDGLIPGQYSIASTYSFYPGKNLGGIGEGGAISTIDEDIANNVRAFRSWGEIERYEHSKFGLNYRMDEIQACALSHKLELLHNANERRRQIADLYIDNLKIDNVNSSLLGEPVHHIFAIKHPNRDALRALLNDKGINTGIHYPKPIHLNEFMPSRSKTPFETKNAISLCSQILSIPIHSSLSNLDVEFVIDSVNNSLEQVGD